MVRRPGALWAARNAADGDGATARDAKERKAARCPPERIAWLPSLPRPAAARTRAPMKRREAVMGDIVDN